MKFLVRLLLLIGLMAGAASPVHAALVINEALLNVPDGADNGFEFVEIKGSASETVNNVWLIEIDSNGTTNGAILNAVNLTSAGTVGTNGLLLIRDAATALVPAADGTTTVKVQDFSPDLENNTTTLALVTNFTGTVGQDLDTNNDGTIDVTLPWSSTLDAVTNQDSAGGDFPHADDLGGTVIPVNASYSPDYIMRDPSNPTVWVRADVTGNGSTPWSGPYTIDATQNSDSNFAGLTATPGSPNASAPSSVGTVPVPRFKEDK